MNAAEFEPLLEEVETRLERLRALYEQYFQGIERLEPTIPKKDLERRMRALRRAQPRNTALRFRFQRVLQRYTTYQTYWKRVARQIEEGTYRRDVMRARSRREEARARRKAEREEEAQTYEIDIDVDLGGLSDEALLSSDAIEDALSVLQPVAPKKESVKPSLSPFGLPKGPKAGKTDAQEPSADEKTEPLPRVASPVSPRKGPVPRNPTPAPPAPASRTFPPPKRNPESVAQAKAYRRAAPSSNPARPLNKGTNGKAPPAPPRPARANGKPSANGARRATASGGDPALRDLYQRYLDARRRNNERTDNVRYETVAKSIEKMMPKLQAKHKGKKIDFEVVLKNGKVGLKPVAK
ncbi:MAG: MXAN_5187 C-terminal domain-containing protein [Myxococcota bacterium]